MITTVLIILVVAVPAIILHECAHGWAANKLGDPTAKILGRLTLNPIKHVDPVGTIIVPAVLYLVHAFGLTHSLFIFGWAKPVPVNFSRLRSPKRDMALVGLAGPLTNIILAFMFIQLIHWGILPAAMSTVLFWGVILNVSLAVFNMIPIPPLDGSRVVAAFLPPSIEKMYHYLEPFGIVIVLVGLQLKLFDFLDPLILSITKGLGL